MNETIDFDNKGKPVREDMKPFIQKMLDNGLELKICNCGSQINAKDLKGIWHSYWPSKGTVLLHASNDANDHRTLTIYNQAIENFIKGMKTKNLVGLYFK